MAGIGNNVTIRVYQCQWSILIVDMVKEQLLNSSKQFNIHTCKPAVFFGVALMHRSKLFIWSQNMYYFLALFLVVLTGKCSTPRKLVANSLYAS